MREAAINNYRKALELYPDAPEPKRRLKKTWSRLTITILPFWRD